MGLFSRKDRRADASEPARLLIADHEKVERLFADIESADSVAQRQALVSQLYGELTRHTLTEERVLYPFVRDNVEGGFELVRDAEQEHAEAKAALARVATLDATTAAFGDALHQLEKLVGHHVDEEESKLFPALESSTTDEELRRLRTELEQVKVEESPTPQLPREDRAAAPRSEGRPRSSGRRASAKAAVWVQPHHTDDSRWQVRRELASRASRVFDTQAEAEKFGRQLARREKVELIVAGRDGEIRQKQSYGNDPARVAG